MNGTEESEYPRNVVAPGEVKRIASEVSLWRRVFGCREISRRATVSGDSERTNAPSTATRLLAVLEVTQAVLALTFFRK